MSKKWVRESWGNCVSVEIFQGGEMERYHHEISGHLDNVCAFYGEEGSMQSLDKQASWRTRALLRIPQQL
jgi:hypothetical protein